MAFMRRSLRLTSADVERVNALRLRSGVNVSFSDVFVAALVHYRAQHPLEDAVMEPLNAQLMRDTVENGDDAKVTSFSLLDHEAVIHHEDVDLRLRTEPVAGHHPVGRLQTRDQRVLVEREPARPRPAIVGRT